MTDNDNRSSAGTPEPGGPNSSPACIVGIGASAGGLEALRTLFARLKSVRRLSFVVVQHLAPQHRSRMVELIAHETSLTVKEISDGIEPEPGVIYITPPNADLVYRDGVLRLQEPAPKIGPKPSVDLFLTSLAETVGHQAIGVILSGTGSDGSHGVRAIRAAGGLTICQSADSAKYDGMPRAAMQTGAVDLCLAVEDIADELARVDGESESCAVRKPVPTPLVVHDGDPFQQILATLEERTGSELTDYKQSTIRRRIERRMIATEQGSLENYADYIAQSPAEAALLLSDILISVTAFFRDKDAFEALARQIEEQIHAKQGGAQYRCWVAGCATGEEAFSVAILVREAMEKLRKRMRVQIFATDLDDKALQLARRACYSKASLTELPDQLVQRYFQPVDDRFQVVPEIRDMVIFAKHNLTNDPPFLGLDLVTCRNVLIYFTGRLQERVLRLLHYGLHPRGRLFLGRSETASQPAGCFEPVDKQAKIYLRVGKSKELPSIRSRHEQQREAEFAARDQAETGGIEAMHSLIAAVAPDSVLIDEERRVRQIYGNAGDYLRLPVGMMTMAINKMLPQPVAVELGTLLHRAAKTGRAVLGQHHVVDLARLGKIRLRLQAIPITNNKHREYIVAFSHSELREEPEPGKAAAKAHGNRSARVGELEAELRSVREQLQHSLEEHETVNEELQALNEELQSANEELQSSNEELETTNEELQSTNEELTTLNQELNVKTAELQTLNQRLSAIQSAISYPLLIVDRDYRLQNFNPAARYLLRVTDADLGTGLQSIPSYLDIRIVGDLVQRVLDGESEDSTAIELLGRHFEIRAHPFHDGKGAVSGAVISFVEVTELRQALAEARLRQDQVLAITENTPALITMKDSQGIYTYANSRFCEVTGRPLTDVIGRTDEELFGAEQGGRIRARDFDILKHRQAAQQEEELELNGAHCWWLSSRFPLLDGQNRAYSICTVSLDISQRVVHERALALFQQALTDATDGIVILKEDDDGRAYRVSYRSGSLLRGRIEQGQPLPDVVGQLFAEAQDTDRRHLLQMLATKGSVSEIVCIGDEDQWLQVRGQRLDLDNSDGRYLVMILSDVTSQVRAEKALQEQKDTLNRFSRFAALGEVAAGISHEISTPLNAITTRTELLRRMVEQDRIDGKRMNKATRDIDRMVDNIDQVIIGLKSISRMAGGDERQRINVQSLLENAVRLVSFSTRRRGVPVQIEVEDPELQMWCNPVQIGQILVNLINNALDAVADKETPWIRVAAHHLDDQVAIDVIDSGDGVRTEIAERIMTPFFTTKGRNGTGLGLSLSRTLARHHGGDLMLRHECANTTFRLVLPKQQVEKLDEESAEADSRPI